MIAIGMNGEPLPIEHGFPVRLVVPGLYGYVSATKWVTDIELTTFADFDAYWVPRGWSQQAPIKTESRIDKPRGGSRFAPGQTVIAGVAWAPHRGISKVEVQVDDGPWQVATLGMVASIDTWRLWSLPWNATPGDHQLRVRATDNAGETQTSQEAPPAPNGATGWHTDPGHRHLTAIAGLIIERYAAARSAATHERWLSGRPTRSGEGAGRRRATGVARAAGVGRAGPPGGTRRPAGRPGRTGPPSRWPAVAAVPPR